MCYQSACLLRLFFFNLQSLSDHTEVDKILESFSDDIEAGMNFTNFGKLLIGFANVMQKQPARNNEPPWGQHRELPSCGERRVSTTAVMKNKNRYCVLCLFLYCGGTIFVTILALAL